jgi:hypothetical protein
MQEKNGGDIKDRKLGDEWEEWKGDLDESRSYNETAGLFTLFAGAALGIVLAGILFVLYMIEPRLYLFDPFWVKAARFLALVAVVSMAALGILTAASVFTGKNLVLRTGIGQRAVARILPVAIMLARRAGISRDRLGNSFVAFSNAMVKAARIPIEGKTIVLIPRCLNAETRKAVQELCERAGVGVFSATGGGQARKILHEERPAGVIAVACERDLVSGIKDVAHKIPTIGIANKRPEGPCKNTVVDLDDLKKAINIMTGADLG